MDETTGSKRKTEILQKMDDHDNSNSVVVAFCKISHSVNLEMDISNVVHSEK